MAAVHDRLLGRSDALSGSVFYVVQTDFSSSELEELPKLIAAYGGVTGQVPDGQFIFSSRQTKSYTLTSNPSKAVCLQQLVDLIKANSAVSAPARAASHDPTLKDKRTCQGSSNVANGPGGITTVDNEPAGSTPTMLEVRLALQASLCRDVAWGPFQVSGILDTATNPSLNVFGVGSIKLPLSESSALSLIGLKHPWSLASWNPTFPTALPGAAFVPQELNLGHPFWAHAIAKATKQACMDLDLARFGTWTAALRGMLLETPNGVFSRQHDPCGRPTLEVVLPSYHQGGGRSFSLGSWEVFFSRIDQLQHDIKYHAWLAGTTAHCEPLEAGYRLALLYDLVPTSSVSSPFSALARLDKLSVLRRTLQEWASLATTACSSDHRPRWLVAPIKEVAPWQEMDIDCLEGESEVLIWRGNLTMNTGDSTRQMVFRFDWTRHSSASIDREDQAARTFGIDARDLVDQYIVRPDDVLGVDYAELEGFVSQSTTQSDQHRGVLAYVFMPRHNLVELAFEHGRSNADIMRTMLDAIVNRIKLPQCGGQQAKEGLARLFSMIREDPAMAQAMHSDATCFMEAATVLKDLEMFTWACRTECEVDPMSVSAAQHNDPPTIAQAVTLEQKLEEAGGDLERLKPWHIAWMTAPSSLGQRFSRLASLFGSIAKVVNKRDSQAWFKEVVAIMSANFTLSVSAHDAEMLVDAAHRYESAWLDECLLPMLTSLKIDNGFWLPFLDKVYNNNMPSERKRMIWQAAFNHLLSAHDRRRDESSATGWNVLPQIAVSLDSEQLCTLLWRCVALELPKHARTVLVAVTHEVASKDPSALPDLVERLVTHRSLVKLVQGQDTDGIRAELCAFVQEALRVYVNAYVGKEPLRQSGAQHVPERYSGTQSYDGLESCVLNGSAKPPQLQKSNDNCMCLDGEKISSLNDTDLDQPLASSRFERGDARELPRPQRVESALDDLHRRWCERRSEAISLVKEMHPTAAEVLLGDLYSSLVDQRFYAGKVAAIPSDTVIVIPSSSASTSALSIANREMTESSAYIQDRLLSRSEVKPDIKEDSLDVGIRNHILVESEVKPDIEGDNPDVGTGEVNQDIKKYTQSWPPKRIKSAIGRLPKVPKVRDLPKISSG